MHERKKKTHSSTDLSWMSWFCVGGIDMYQQMGRFFAKCTLKNETTPKNAWNSGAFLLSINPLNFPLFPSFLLLLVVFSKCLRLLVKGRPNAFLQVTSTEIYWPRSLHILLFDWPRSLDNDLILIKNHPDETLDDYHHQLEREELGP